MFVYLVNCFKTEKQKCNFSFTRGGSLALWVLPWGLELVFASTWSLGWKTWDIKPGMTHIRSYNNVHNIYIHTAYIIYIIYTHNILIYTYTYTWMDQSYGIMELCNHSWGHKKRSWVWLLTLLPRQILLELPCISWVATWHPTSWGKEKNGSSFPADCEAWKPGK